MDVYATWEIAVNKVEADCPLLRGEGQTFGHRVIWTWSYLERYQIFKLHSISMISSKNIDIL